MSNLIQKKSLRIYLVVSLIMDLRILGNTQNLELFDPIITNFKWIGY